MSINETVLEMHYHKPLMDLFRETYGVGATGALNFYKYCPQLEVFIGFDQAYAKSQLTEKEFFDLLKKSAKSNNYKLSEKFVGYFLQYKVVSVMKNKTSKIPIGITAKPHYRSHLETSKNANTGVSQHEMLFRLSRNPGALAYYACPMLFDRSALYEVYVDLDTLRLPDLKHCPSEYGDNSKHHIYFNGPQDIPVWCSDPVNGESIDPRTLARTVINKIKQGDSAQLAAELLDTLSNLERFGLTGKEEFFTEYGSPPSMLKLLSSSLTIVRLTESKDA